MNGCESWRKKVLLYCFFWNGLSSRLSIWKFAVSLVLAGQSAGQLRQFCWFRQSNSSWSFECLTSQSSSINAVFLSRPTSGCHWQDWRPHQITWRSRSQRANFSVGKNDGTIVCSISWTRSSFEAIKRGARESCVFSCGEWGGVASSLLWALIYCRVFSCHQWVHLS